MCIFLMASFKIFFLFFLRFEYECFNVFVFVFIYPHWFSLDLWFGIVINFEKFSNIIASNISFVSLFLLTVFLSCVCCTFWCSAILGCSIFFLLFLPLYMFYFERFLLIVFKFTDSFLACVESTDEPLEEILNFYFCVWFLASFDCFLEFLPVYISLLFFLKCCLLFPLDPLIY